MCHNWVTVTETEQCLRFPCFSKSSSQIRAQVYDFNSNISRFSLNLIPVLDLIRNLIPANIIYATFAQVSTYRKIAEVAFDCSNLTSDLLTDDFFQEGNFSACESSTKLYELRKTLDSGYSYERCNEWTSDNFTESKMAYECKWKGLGEDYTVKQTGKPRENILGILLFSIGIALAITRTKDDETRVLRFKFFSNQKFNFLTNSLAWKF